MNSEQILASAVALTNAAAASTNSANIKSCNQHSLYIKWTPGVSSNVLTVTVELSPDGTDWYQDMQLADSSGTKTRQLCQYQHTASGTSATYHRIDLTDVYAEQLRVKYVESDAGGAGKGTITVKLLSDHS